MKEPKSIRIFCAAAAIAMMLSLAGATNATTVSYDTSYGPFDVGSAPGYIGSSLPQFDPILGTLTKVTLTLDSETSAGTIYWDNEAAIETDVTLGIGATVTAKALSVLTTTAVPMQTDSATGIAADNDGAPDFSGIDSFGITSGIGIDTSEDWSTNPTVLALFTGTGTFDIWMSSIVESYFTTSGGFGPSIPTPGMTEGTITISYNYIPEPATIAILGFGGLRVLLKRRRR